MSNTRDGDGRNYAHDVVMICDALIELFIDLRCRILACERWRGGIVVSIPLIPPDTTAKLYRYNIELESGTC